MIEKEKDPFGREVIRVSLRPMAAKNWCLTQLEPLTLTLEMVVHEIDDAVLRVCAE